MGRAMHRAVAALATAVCLSWGGVVNAQQAVPRRVLPLEDVDPGRPGFERLLEDLGFAARRMNLVLPIAPAQADRMTDRLAACRRQVLTGLLDALSGPARQQWLVYLENGPRFGDELGFVDLDEIQKHKLRQLQEARADRLAGSRRGRSDELDRRYTTAVEKLLTREQIERLRQVQAARRDDPLPPLPPAPSPEAEALRKRLAELPGQGGRKQQVECVTEVDLQGRRIVGLSRLYTSRLLVHVGRDDTLADGKVVSAEMLAPGRPVALLYDGPDGYYPDLTVQANAAEMTVVHGRVKRLTAKGLALADSVLGVLPLAPQCRVRSDGRFVAPTALAPGRYVSVVLVRKEGASAWQASAVLDRGETDAGHRHVQGVMWGHEVRSRRNAHLYVAGGGRGQVSLPVSEEFRVLDHGSGTVLTLGQLAEKLAAGPVSLRAWEVRGTGRGRRLVAGETNLQD